MQIIYRHIEQGSLFLFRASSLSSGWAGLADLPDLDAASLPLFQSSRVEFLMVLFLPLSTVTAMIVGMFARCLHSNAVQNTYPRGTLRAACLAAESAYEAHLVIPRGSLKSLTALAAAAQNSCTGAGPLQQLEAVGLSASLVSLCPPCLPPARAAAEAAGRFCSSEVRQDANERPKTGDRFCRALGGAAG